jgi:hypothetical protein
MLGIRNFKPETLKPKLRTPNLESRNFKPETRYKRVAPHKPETRSFKHNTRNPEPETSNQEAGTRSPYPRPRKFDLSNPEPETLNPMTLESESRNLKTETRIHYSKLQSRILEPETSNPKLEIGNHEPQNSDDQTQT